MTTVLYLQTGHCEVNARSLDGAMAFARDAGVRLQLVECWRKLEVGKRVSSPEALRKAFLAVHGETLAAWRRQRVDPLSI